MNWMIDRSNTGWQQIFPNRKAAEREPSALEAAEDARIIAEAKRTMADPFGAALLAPPTPMASPARAAASLRHRIIGEMSKGTPRDQAQAASRSRTISALRKELVWQDALARQARSRR